MSALKRLQKPDTNFGKSQFALALNMKPPDPLSTVRLFNEHINNRDLAGLADLMSEDHVFIDSSDDVHTGKQNMVASWRLFFEEYPDYRNHFEYIEARGDIVLISGYSTCSFEPLDGPALWTAKLKDGFVEEWRVYKDTEQNRREIGLPG
jgi:ketosteroid isomerase-like protein